jgi:serine/threonine protein kinase
MPHHNRPTSPTHPISLKLFLRNQLLLTLYQKQDTIDRWQELLLKHLNQRNFKTYFQAIKKLGKGNFASVYLCKQLKDGKLFAVKAFSKEENYGQEKGK